MEFLGYLVVILIACVITALATEHRAKEREADLQGQIRLLQGKMNAHTHGGGPAMDQDKAAPPGVKLATVDGTKVPDHRMPEELTARERLEKGL